MLTRKLQELINQIADERRLLLEAVTALSDAQLDYRPGEGGWSISDILHHLSLSDEANVKLSSIMLKQAAEKNLPPDGSPEASVLRSLDGLNGRLNTRVKAPDRVAPRSHLPAAQSLARLNASRQKLLDVVEELSRYDLAQLSWPHPFLGDLNLYQWLIMAGKHESRHTRQIGRIKADPLFPS